MKTTIKTICLLAFLGFAMQTQAQTKEETIKWIKEKIIKCAAYNYKEEIQITSCEIVEVLVTVDGNIAKWKSQVVPNIHYVINDTDNTILFKYNDGLKLARGGNVNSSPESSDYFIKITNTEENIAERMLKALKYLSTFCSQGKNETF